MTRLAPARDDRTTIAARARGSGSAARARRVVSRAAASATLVVAAAMATLAMAVARATLVVAVARATLAMAALAAGVVGCGGDLAPPPPAVAPRLGASHLLPLLDDGTPPFTHAAEPSIAARDGVVVIAAVQLQLPDAERFDEGELYGRRVAVVRSDDGGEHFGPAVDPGLAPDTSDPVVRIGPGGRLYLAALDAEHPLDPPIPGLLGVSTDGGRGFATLVSTRASGAPPWGDRDAFTVEPAGTIAVAAELGFWRYDASGRTVAADPTVAEGGMSAAFSDAAGAHFARNGHGEVLVFDGAGRRSVERTAPSLPDDTRGGQSLGRTPDGHVFWLRRSEALGVVLDLYRSEVPGGVEIPLAGRSTFLPAGALDGDGRLHVVFYDTAGARGVLRYLRSRSSDLAGGFGDALVVDDDACPGGGWSPARHPNERRRLREYIDLAVDGRHAHVAWTHAPAAPARVYAARIDF